MELSIVELLINVLNSIAIILLAIGVKTIVNVLKEQDLWR